jgi:hypothetical protein
MVDIESFALDSIDIEWTCIDKETGEKNYIRN